MPLPTTNWHLPSTSTRIKPCAAAAADFQQPHQGEELKVESRNEALCAPELLTEQVSRYLDVFRNQFYEPRSCISSYWEKHKNLSRWQLFLMSSGRLLQKVCARLQVLPLHQNLPSHLCSPLWAVSQSDQKCCLLDYSPHFPPNHSSHVVHFFFYRHHYLTMICPWICGAKW